MSKRDYISEILEVKGRKSPFDHPSNLLLRRIMELNSTFKEIDAFEPELCRYVPISLVACMEGFLRGILKELIDSGSPFSDNIAKLNIVNIKYDSSVVKAIHGRIITLGDLISHQVPLNNLSSINNAISIISNKDFLKEIALVHDRWKVEIHGAPRQPIIDNSDLVYRDVEKIFELRHIYCHELLISRKEKINKDELSRAYKNCITFLYAVDEFFWNLVAPDRPLTQTDMNIKAAEDLRKADNEMNEICAQIFLKIDSERKKEFDKAHDAWKNFRDSYATFKADAYKGGTISPLIYGKAAESVIKTRIEQLKEYLAMLNRYEDAS